MNQADIQWNSLGLQATLLMPLDDPTGSILVFHGLTGQQKAICKRQTFLSIAILLLCLDSA